jgi:hypothetical protein
MSPVLSSQSYFFKFLLSSSLSLSIYIL